MNTRTATGKSKRLTFWLTLAATFWWTGGFAAAAEELVTCRYLQAKGQKIELLVQVGAPPPASLIVTQMVPPGIKVENSSPPLKRYDQQKGEAKWLLQGVESGQFQISLQLATPVEPAQLSGEIRYKHPRTGAMVAMPLAP